MHAQDGLIKHTGQEGHFLDLLTSRNLAGLIMQRRGDLGFEKLVFLLARHHCPFTPIVSKPVKERKE